MKTRYKILFCLVILLLLGSIWKSNGIARRVNYVRNYLSHERIIKRLHKMEADISSLPAFVSDGSEYFTKYHFISHNGGIIQGRLHSGSLEAWELSYNRGNRIIDADLEFTSDNKIVLRHGWAENLEQGQEPNIMTHKDFKNSLIFRKYHPLDLDDMINFMLTHEDLYIAVDSKRDAAKTFDLLVKTAKNLNAESILDRIIVSLYNFEDVVSVKKIYQFKNFALRQCGWQHNWYKLAEFCLKNNIRVVNIFDFVIDSDPEGVKILTSKNIHVFAAVVNNLSQLEKYKSLGITGAVSDFLSESDWSLIK